jgi:hypothetical protein
MLKQHLFKYHGHIGAYLVVAGVDPTGVHLFTVHAHGSTDKLPYVTMGSGSLAAMAVFESTWKKGMTREEAVELCSQAIQAGIFNDLGSGSNVDVCVITKEKVRSMKPQLGLIKLRWRWLIYWQLGHDDEELCHAQRACAQRTELQICSGHDCVSQRESGGEERSQEICNYCGPERFCAERHSEWGCDGG